MPAGSNYWVSDGMLADRICNVDLNGDGIAEYVRFSLTNKFLHPNHPLGWIKGIHVKIDHQEIAREKMYFVIRGQWIPLKFMPTIRDIWWHTLEPADIYIEMEPLSAGKHTLECIIDISLHVHTENLDPENIFPCLHCKLNGTLEAVEEALA